MSSWKAISALEDGQNVDAATLNKPLSELASRTLYLKELLDSLRGSGEFTSVRFSVRLSDENTPSIGDVVCIDPETKTYVKASASMSLFDAYRSSFKCFAIGLLVAKQDDNTGTVVAFGLVDLSSGGFNLENMLEPDELFRNGMYYLSSNYPGKLTSEPEGPRIQIGVFTSNPQVNSDEPGDYAVISPQYGDVMSHLHRTYELAPKPAGTPVASMNDSNDLVHVEVKGYRSDAIRASGQADPSDVVPYLKLGGEWLTKDDVSYVFWLSAEASSDPSGSSPPSSDFTSVFLNWKSSDGKESGGSERIKTFYHEVEIGNYGLVVSLEPGSYSLEKVYEVATDTVDTRTWSVRMPAYAKGWSQNSVYEEAEFGGVLCLQGTPSMLRGEVHAFAPEYIFKCPDETPGVGSVLNVDGVKYQFIDADTDESELDEGMVPVPISADAFETFANMACVFGDRGNFAVVPDPVNREVYIGASSALLDNVALEQAATGGGTVSDSSSANFLLYDETAYSVVSTGYAVLSGFFNPIATSVGVSVYLQREVSPVTIEAGATADFDIETGCPGAKFRYNIQMDQALNSSFPPVPAKSGSLMLNGVELESDEFFGAEANYGIGADTLYWYNDGESWLPWPVSFVDPEIPLPKENAFRLLFHFISSFHSTTGPVISLRPAHGSPITVKKCGTGVDATVGDLEIDVDMTASVYDANVPGYKTVKASRNGRLLLGPVVERITAGPGITIDQRYGQPTGQGTVTISATNATYSGDFDTVALENAKEEMIGMFPYIRFLGWGDGGTNIDTGFVAKFHVPTNIADGVYRVRIYATVFGEAPVDQQPAPEYAGLSMEYNVLPEWTPISGKGIETASYNVKNDLIKCDEKLDVNIPFGRLLSDGETYGYTAFDPILVHNDTSIADVEGKCSRAFGDAFPTEDECKAYLSSHIIGTSTFGVRPGFVVAVRLSRSDATMGTPYTGRIGIQNLRWSLVRVEDEKPAESRGNSDCCEVIDRLQDVAATLNPSNVRTVDQLRSALLKIIAQLK